MREPAPQWSEFGEVPEPLAAIESGDLRAALSGFATLHLLDYRVAMPVYSDVYICGFGATLWLMGDALGAATVWSRVCDEALKGRYSYSSTGTFHGGLLLWFAAVWLEEEEWHNQAARLFDKLLGKKHPVMGADFASLLARLLRGDIDLDEVRAGFYHNAPQARESQERETLFYAGVRAYENGDTDETRRLWMQVKDPSESQVELEYYLLAYERQRLGSKRSGRRRRRT